MALPRVIKCLRVGEWKHAKNPGHSDVCRFVTRCTYFIFPLERNWPWLVAQRRHSALHCRFHRPPHWKIQRERKMKTQNPSAYYGGRVSLEGKKYKFVLFVVHLSFALRRATSLFKWNRSACRVEFKSSLTPDRRKNENRFFFSINDTQPSDQGEPLAISVWFLHKYPSPSDNVCGTGNRSAVIPDSVRRLR